MENKQKLLGMLIYLAIALVIVSAYGALVMGAGINKYYYLGFIATAAFALLALKLHFERSFIKTIINLKKNWGKEKEKKRSFEEIEELFNYLSRANKEKFYIDKQTYDDLNLDKIFEKLDRTSSTPGEQVLYSMLRTPMMDNSSFKKRNDIIEFFMKNPAVREKLQIELARLGRQRGSLITSFLWDSDLKEFKYRYVFNILALLGCASVWAYAFVGWSAIVNYMLPIFAINAYVHYKIKKMISGQLNTIQYMHRLLRACQRIAVMNIPELSEYMSILKNRSEIINKLYKKTSINFDQGLSDVEVIAEYIYILTMNEERKYFGAIRDIKGHIEELRDIFLAIGELDALISMASYRAGLEGYTIPKLQMDGAMLRGKNLAHPLLEEPVRNSITIDREGIIITGSNMSGKSTFLRTVGINALFAQTLCICLAEEYEGSFLKILTSISQGDNIIGGKSYYFAEAESLLRIINSAGDKVPCLCIIDEIFRGTNPVERTSASVEILDYLVNNNALVIVATHDLEITEMVKGVYEYYYFSEDISQAGLNFDYKIKEGVSKNRNAVKLMNYLGYPKEIIDKTTVRVSSLI